MAVTLGFLEIFVVVIQRLICNKLFRKKNIQKVYEAVIWASFFVLFNSLTYIGTVPVYANLAVFVAGFLGVLLLVYEGVFHKKLMLVLFLYILGMSSEIIVYQGACMIGVDASDLLVQGKERLLCIVISKLVWFMILWILFLLWKKWQGIEVNKVDWIAALLVPISSMFISYAIIDLNNSNINSVNFMAVCLIILINLLTFYLYDRVRENALSQAEKEYIQKQIEYYAKVNDELGQYWFDMRCFRHDIKQRYILEQGYLCSRDYEKLAACYREVLGLLNKEHIVANTGNVSIDNIINYKSIMAEKKGITVNADLLIPYNIELSDPEICSLLGNLLDNAIEATEKPEVVERVIHIKMKLIGSNMLISIRNPYTELREDEKLGYLTTKPDKQAHGYGLKIIRNIVKKYNGEMVQERDDKFFYTKIFLYDVCCEN